MKDHITKLSQSCYYQLRQIRAVRHSLTQTAIQTLVHGLRLHTHRFCKQPPLWDKRVPPWPSPVGPQLCCTFDPQNRQYDPISSAIRRDLHWLPIRFRVHFKLNSITSNCLAGRAPEYLTELCHSVNDIPARRNLRSSSQVQLLVPRFRKERSGRRGFSVSSPQLWNLLPVDIRLHHNEHQLFRRRLKTHYMQQSLLHHWGSMSPVRTLLLLLLLLLTLLSNVTRLLETNPYVIVYVLDFSKAFDTVRHYTLLEKMALLNMPDQIYNWFVTTTDIPIVRPSVMRSPTSSI